MKTNAVPYLSIVVTSRNDNHGQDLLPRTTLFVNGLIAQCTRFNLPAELIVVEWNPPPQNPPLHAVLPAPPPDCPLRVRYITVPPQLHRQYANAGNIPLYQMIAKNVGIRRAKGQFVLCTNIDLLFSDELFEILARKDLQPDCCYRADRCDVPDDVLRLNRPLPELLQWCSRHVMKRWSRNRLLLAFLNGMIKVDKTRLLNGLVRKKLPFLYFLHLVADACGDFTLLAKPAWEAIQGYPELDLYSVHIDTMGIAAAEALGYRQVLLPAKACTYHIYHLDGWTSLSATQKIKFLEKRPGLGIDVVVFAALEAIRNRQPYNLNPANWGFAGIDLEEVEG